MRLTVYTDYSLRVLIYLAVQKNRLATIPEIASSYGISRNHLVKVGHQLGVYGYVITTRGIKGGLRLARSADEINIGDVVRRMEPDMAVVPCLSPTKAFCPIVPSCRLRTVMEEARAAFLAVLDTYTLADLASPRDELTLLLQISPMPSEKA